MPDPNVPGMLADTRDAVGVVDFLIMNFILGELNLL
jgi:hypothetical protein